MEIHVQLATRSKMFTAAANGFGGAPNSRVDAQVLGLPGTLPVLNRQAIEHSITVGLALNCQINRQTKWDRKSYYYPDLPKNYQISQYDLPLCYEGRLAVGDREVRIRRAHLEEDAGKLLHESPGGFPIDHSIVDLNRAGTPLLEIVTEPDLSSGKEVAAFGQALQKLVQYLGVSEAQMQMGHMRFEPNINVHITDGDGAVHKTAITEIKNLNSFSVLERATDFEAARQIREWIDNGSLGRKSTYGWNESTGETFHQRDKENEQDYRYFPDPDLLPIEISDEWIAALRSRIGESSNTKSERFFAMGISRSDASTLADSRATADLFEKAVSNGAPPKRVANVLIQHGLRLAKDVGRPMTLLGLDDNFFSDAATAVESGKVAASSLGPIFDAALTGETFDAVATQQNAIVTGGSDAIDTAIDLIIAENSKSLQDYRAGKAAALGALVGAIMKSTSGLSAKAVREQLVQRLKP